MFWLTRPFHVSVSLVSQGSSVLEVWRLVSEIRTPPWNDTHTSVIVCAWVYPTSTWAHAALVVVDWKLALCVCHYGIGGVIQYVTVHRWRGVISEMLIWRPIWRVAACLLDFCCAHPSPSSLPALLMAVRPLIPIYMLQSSVHAHPKDITFSCKCSSLLLYFVLPLFCHPSSAFASLSLTPSLSLPPMCFMFYIHIWL